MLLLAEMTQEFINPPTLEKRFRMKQEFSREDGILGTRVYTLRLNIGISESEVRRCQSRGGLTPPQVSMWNLLDVA